MSASQVPDEIVEELEAQVAPDCGDCGTSTEFRGIQGGGDVRFNLQFICPDCDPQRVQVMRPPEWLQIEAPADGRGDDQAGLERWSG